MCNRHEILDFIEARLDDSFSSKLVWDQVSDHHEGAAHPVFVPDFNYKCRKCQARTYPCPTLREVASYWKDDEDFDPDWTFPHE